MKYYVVSDVHGFYTPLRRALAEKGFFDGAEPKKLIVCGDLFDRGGEAVELQAFMMELLRKDELIYILGNHEDLMPRMLHDIVSRNVFPMDLAMGSSYHTRNGTWSTALQLSGFDEAYAVDHPFELVTGVKNSDFYSVLLRRAVDYYETDRYIFVHGYLPCTQRTGFPSGYTYDPNWRAASVYEWERARWYNGMDMAWKYGIREPNKTVVCGHWHASYGHFKIDGKGDGEFGPRSIHTPYSREGLLAIDACTAYSGQVNCVVLDDERTEK